MIYKQINSYKNFIQIDEAMNNELYMLTEVILQERECWE
jgi:hypothetical protein